ncbi:hypothetical protein BGZ63DRAFT_405393 [Mariannaea sp. PMI_226]|nr:hypothetical protein BGZ63DRAFT_405393 [Mariannaea sp. PMI_226]
MFIVTTCPVEINNQSTTIHADISHALASKDGSVAYMMSYTVITSNEYSTYGTVRIGTNPFSTDGTVATDLHGFFFVQKWCISHTYLMHHSALTGEKRRAPGVVHHGQSWTRGIFRRMLWGRRGRHRVTLSDSQRQSQFKRHEQITSFDQLKNHHFDTLEHGLFPVISALLWSFSPGLGTNNSPR